MSKGVMKIKPKGTKPNEVQRSVEPHANLSILELMDGITNTTEDLQEVMRRLDDLSYDTDVLNQQVASAYRDYLEAKTGLDEHLKTVEQFVQKKRFLYAQLAGYSDAFKNRMGE